ncbi:MAG: Inner membrane protein YpjD [Gammaproteobacteria bacterium]|nr:Inner membrane protein YpjD [Gammaproteobacteria bacterium]
MLTPILSLSAGGLYVGAGALIIKHLWGTRPATLRLVFALILCAVLAHSVLLYFTVLSQTAAIDVGFTNAASLTAWIVTIIFLATASLKPAYELGAVILPVSAVSVIAAWLWPPSTADTVASAGLSVHMPISLAAYGFLALAVVQSLVMWLQDRRLRGHREATVLGKLPPMETMERLLFQLIGIGFVLLSLGLLSGFWFSAEQHGSAFVFNHHTVLSLIAWLVFGNLLLGHWRFGWRGKTAIRWTLGGFIVLVLAYFGWKFVLEILLNRG